jgi:hypothetical protein
MRTQVRLRALFDHHRQGHHYDALRGETYERVVERPLRNATTRD